MKHPFQFVFSTFYWGFAIAKFIFLSTVCHNRIMQGFIILMEDIFRRNNVREKFSFVVSYVIFVIFDDAISVSMLKYCNIFRFFVAISTYSLVILLITYSSPRHSFKVANEIPWLCNILLNCLFLLCQREFKKPGFMISWEYGPC